MISLNKWAGLCVGGLLLAIVASAEAEGTIDPRGMPDGTAAGATTRYSLWCDTGKGQALWHLRTMTAKGVKQHFKARIEATTNGAIDSTAGFHLEPWGGPAGDRFTISADKKAIVCDFDTIGVWDGVDFHITGNPQMLKFTLDIENKFDGSKIYIGKKGAHPDKDGFELKAHGEPDGDKGKSDK